MQELSVERDELQAADIAELQLTASRMQQVHYRHHDRCALVA
jgi:hypothetical protein